MATTQDLLNSNQAVLPPKEYKLIVKGNYTRGNSELYESRKYYNVTDLNVLRWDGYKMDKIRIGVTLTTKQEAEHIIRFLEYHKHCLQNKP